MCKSPEAGKSLMYPANEKRGREALGKWAEGLHGIQFSPAASLAIIVTSTANTFLIAPTRCQSCRVYAGGDGDGGRNPHLCCHCNRGLGVRMPGVWGACPLSPSPQPFPSTFFPSLGA